MKMLENGKYKSVRSENYNYDFRKEDGFFKRWGKTPKDDPQFSPYGSEILDVEVSERCSLGCTACYKTNTPFGKNMSLETFKTILNKIPRNVNQIAFGIGSLDLCPELWDIMSYCRNNPYNQVVPNLTINGFNFTDEQADKLSSLCGAIAVSKYYPKDVCYDAVKKLTDRGMKQINIHQMVSSQTLKSCYEVINDSKNDPRLAKLNAIVFLILKPKGGRNNLQSVTFKEYKALVDYALGLGVSVGFDSCSANSFLKAVADHPDYEKYLMLSEPCESTMFSLYLNAEGHAFPCSFAEGEGEWKEGIDVVSCDDFIKDVWNHPRMNAFRNKSISNCRDCVLFDDLIKVTDEDQKETLNDTT